MKHDNVNDISDYFQVVRIYSFVKEIKLYIHASHIVFLLVRSENKMFLKEIKHVIRAFIAMNYFLNKCKEVTKYIPLFLRSVS
mgnify:CR=1 FL=1